MSAQRTLTIFAQGILGKDVTVVIGDTVTYPYILPDGDRFSLHVPTGSDKQMVGYTLSLIGSGLFNPPANTKDFKQLVYDDPVTDLAVAFVLSARSDILLDSFMPGCGPMLKNVFSVSEHKGLRFLAQVGRHWCPDDVYDEAVDFMGEELVEKVWDSIVDVLVPKKELYKIIPVVEVVKQLLLDWKIRPPQENLVDKVSGTSKGSISDDVLDDARLGTDLGLDNEFFESVGSLADEGHIDSSWFSRSPNAEETAVANKLSIMFSQLIADISAGWEDDEPHGKINMTKMMQPVVNVSQAFSSWTPGMEEEIDCEIVILVDRSASMAKNLDVAFGHCWAVKHALAQNTNGSKVTILAYDDDEPLIHEASSSDVLFCEPGGGTRILASLSEAKKILDNSENTHKIAIILTDGEWTDGYLAMPVLNDFGHHVGIVFWGDEGGYDIQGSVQGKDIVDVTKKLMLKIWSKA